MTRLHFQGQVILRKAASKEETGGLQILDWVMRLHWPPLAASKFLNKILTTLPFFIWWLNRSGLTKDFSLSILT